MVEPVYGLARVLAYPIRPAFRFVQRGREHVPRNGPVLLASNHVSFVDPLFLLWVGERTHRKVRFLAMSELWKVRGLRFFLKHTGQIPVPRGTAGAGTSLTRAVSALKRGECLAVFPEGGISPTLELRPAKTGIARLAGLTGAPIVPIGLWGGQRVYPKGHPRRLRPGVAVSIVAGPPVLVDADEDPCRATDRVMGAIASCLRTAREIYPQRPRDGSDEWWVRAPDTAVALPTHRNGVDRWS